MQIKYPDKAKDPILIPLLALFPCTACLLLAAFYLLIVLHALQLALLANAEIQKILPLVLQGFLVSLRWEKAQLSGFQLVPPASHPLASLLQESQRSEEG